MTPTWYFSAIGDALSHLEGNITNSTDESISVRYKMNSGKFFKLSIVDFTVKMCSLMTVL